MQEIKQLTVLNETELAAIAKLADVCNQHDGIRLKLNWEFLQQRKGERTDDFLFYLDGELIGSLHVYEFNKREVEISGMVHPDHRRNGVFRQLYALAEESIRQRGIPNVILIVNHESAGGQSFSEASGAAYSFSEFQMELNFAKAVPPATDRIQLREAVYEDRFLLNRLTSEGFGIPLDTMRELTPDQFESGGEGRYLAELDGKVIGKIGTFNDPECGLIFGFVVDQQHQGRGYGREILCKTIQRMIADNYRAVELEVAAKNEGALGLYLSCGFEVVRRMDYYVKALS
ncbi:MAG: GNAT family N-acetyltransferase [Tumebacillaceae bacterium]